jgi:hypothetical protein
MIYFMNRLNIKKNSNEIEREEYMCIIEGLFFNGD